MTKREEVPIPPSEDEPSEQDAPIHAEQPAEKAPDPREEARRRSKEDLARKRRGLHSPRGNR